MNIYIIKKEEVKKMNQRESWSSRFGFIMATAGFAIGLGNIWRFPYLTGMNGGGAFLFVYLILCLAIGMPLFVAEISLGRKTQLNPVDGMRKLTAKGSPWVAIGWFGVVAAFVVLTYYMQIMGWVLAYVVKILTGQMNGLSSEEMAIAFNSFTSNPVQVCLYTLVCVAIIGIISTKGLQQGIEKACKIMMPTLFIMLVILAIRSLTLPGAMEGLKWYLTPDFSKINGSVLLDALGQCFFSIGIASGAAFVYGSYLKPDSDIPGDSTMVVVFDTMAAFISGLVIFPAIFALGLKPDAGSSLLFVTMTNLFSHMPGGSLFGGMFFFLILLAALSSGMGYLEPVAQTISEICNINRAKAVWGSLISIFIIGIPSILAHGPWKDVLIFGKNFFELADYISGNILMTLGGLLIVLYTAYVWKFENFREETNVGAGKLSIGMWWKPLMMFVVPVALIIVIITAIN